MSIECKHGYLARTCDQCEADAEIARLTRELDEARQALEAERARVAELEKLIDEEAEHDTLCGSNRLRQDPCNCWKSRAVRVRIEEVRE